MLDQRSEATLLHVEPELAKVLRTASQEPMPFLVYYGIRTFEAEKAALATGHSTTLHSRHLPDVNGLSAAVDVASFIDGVLDFAKGNEAAVFGQIATQIKEAAASLNIPIEWGGDWVDFKDWGHFQLPWKEKEQTHV